MTQEMAPVHPAEKRPAILLAEDYFANILVADTILDGLGYDCVVAKNGQEAVDLIVQNPDAYLAVLMDVQMPILNGYEATRRIREQEADDQLGKHIPIIGLTAHTQSSDKEKCISAGMDDYIAKPFNPVELEHKLATVARSCGKAA